MAFIGFILLTKIAGKIKNKTLVNNVKIFRIKTHNQSILIGA
jgi:hypothetical protein